MERIFVDWREPLNTVAGRLMLQHAEKQGNDAAIAHAWLVIKGLVVAHPRAQQIARVRSVNPLPGDISTMGHLFPGQIH